VTLPWAPAIWAVVTVVELMPMAVTQAGDIFWPKILQTGAAPPPAESTEACSRLREIASRSRVVSSVFAKL